MAYIEVADIKHRHLKRFDTTELQGYVDTANSKFGEFAFSLGVESTDIPTTLSNTVKDFILSDMYMDIARDNIGSEGSLIGDSNLYQSIYAIANDQYKKLKPRVTRNAIIGETSGTTQSATNWGTIVRG